MMLMAAGFGLWGGAALAAVDTEPLVADLQRQGYTWIEVKRGPTQIEVEAVRGEVKIETVYDTATGTVLDHDTDRASRREKGRSGVEIRDSARDFEVWDDRDDDRDDWDDDRDDDRDDVALFAIKGLSTAEIAAVRQTSEGTVKAQTYAIYRKARVSGRPHPLSLFIDDLMRDHGTIRPPLALPAPAKQPALSAK